MSFRRQLEVVFNGFLDNPRVGRERAAGNIGRITKLK